MPAILGPILASAAGSATTFGLNRLFGGGGSRAPDPIAPPRLGQILDLKKRDRLTRNISRNFAEQAGLIGDLRGQVRPGFGRLTESRLRGIRDRGRRVVGNLRENLARRRVLGSSFAGDALARQELAFANQADAIGAEAFLQELQLSNNLINSEFRLRRGEFETLLDEQSLRDNINAQLVVGSFNAQSAAGREAALRASQNQNSLLSAFQPTIKAAGQLAGTLASNFGTTGSFLPPRTTITPA